MSSPSLFLWDSSFEGKTLVAIIGRLLSMSKICNSGNHIHISVMRGHHRQTESVSLSTMKENSRVSSSRISSRSSRVKIKALHQHGPNKNHYSGIGEAMAAVAVISDHRPMTTAANHFT